jgi:hypothetical protein
MGSLLSRQNAPRRNNANYKSVVPETTNKLPVPTNSNIDTSDISEVRTDVQQMGGRRRKAKVAHMTPKRRRRLHYASKKQSCK